MTTVPGSIPKIILERFCKRRTIFDTDQSAVEQKYQNNRPTRLFAFDGVHYPAGDAPTRVENFTPASGNSHLGPAAMEIMAGAGDDAGQLGHRSP